MKSQESIPQATNKIWSFKNLIYLSTFGTASLILLISALHLADISQFAVKHTGFFVLFLLIIQNSIFLIPIIWLKQKAQISWQEFGFNKVSIIKVISYTLLGFLVFFSFNLAVRIIELTYNIQIPGFGEQETRTTLFGIGLLNQTISFFSIVILAPIMEEIIFRGFVYKTLKSYLSFGPAILVSGLIFALSHMELNVLLPLWSLGIILCYLYSKTNSLITPIVFHAANNALAFAVEVYLQQTPN